MKDSEQLAWEAENGPRFAIAAFAAGFFTLASALVQLVVVGGSAGDEREALMRIDEHQGGFLAILACQAVGYFFLAGVFFYLMKAIMARRSEGLRFLWPLLIAAPILLTIGGILTQIDLASIADKFLSDGAQMSKRAKSLIDDRSPASGIIASIGTLCLALSFVLVSVNAMRAGLFSRFMGIIGIIAGALLILPLLPGIINFVQLFWVVALGFLLLNRWPKGRGPAWDRAEAIPWPTAAQVRGLTESPTDPPDRATGPADDLDDNETEQPQQAARRRNSRKRKRQRR